MRYEDITHLAQTWGLIFLAILFVAASAYALWPANRDTFQRAARAPLQDGDDDDQRD